METKQENAGRKFRYKPVKTFFLTKEEAENDRKWFLIDAEGLTLGRLCTIICNILRGKHSPEFTPNTDCGAGVIVINTSLIYVSGTKEGRKNYYFHSGKPGKLRTVNLSDMRKKDPNYIIMHAVKGMMPKTKLARAQLKKLRLFPENTHNMQAQTPITLAL